MFVDKDITKKFVDKDITKKFTVLLVLGSLKIEKKIEVVKFVYKMIVVLFNIWVH